MDSEKDKKTGANRRKYERLEVFISVKYYFLEGEIKETSYTKDISAGGICFIITKAAPIGTVLFLDIELPGTYQYLHLKGMVTWRDKLIVNTGPLDKYYIGVKFLDINKEQQGKIQGYIQNASIKGDLPYYRGESF